MSGPLGDSWTGQKVGNGRYEIISKLGEGGMGAVYQAWDSNLRTDVVIKVPHATMRHDAEATARFVREASSLVKLSHPHIVKIIDFGEQNGLPYAVMQFLSGGSLSTRQHGSDRQSLLPQSPESLKDWLPSVAKALDFVHAQGYLHRDVKPENILFDAHGNAFLSDFGITKFATARQAADSGKSLTGAGMVLGTPEYMAPEVILGQAVDGRLDQYGLAVTVFEMLAGRRPFEDATPTAVLVRQTTHQPPDLRSLNPKVPAAVAGVVRQALAKEPGQRFSTCTAFSDAVLSASSAAPEKSYVKLKCPSCQQSLKLGAKVRGQTLPCPACRASLKVSEDLRELTVPAPAGARGGTRAVISPGQSPVEGVEDAASEGDMDGSALDIEFEEFPPWESVARETSPTLPQARPSLPQTQAVTASDVPTTRSKLTSRAEQKGSRRVGTADDDRAARMKIYIAGGVAALVAGLVLVIGLVAFLTRGTKKGTDVGVVPPVQAATAPKEVPAAAVAAVHESSPPTKPLNPPAVIFLHIEPPDARITVSDSSASIVKEDSQTRVTIPAANPNQPITITASADNYREVRRDVTPQPGSPQTVWLMLLPSVEAKGHPGFDKPKIDTAQPDRNSDQPAHPLPGGAVERSGSPKLSWKVQSRIEAPNSSIDSVALSPDGSQLATAGSDRMLRLWDARTGKMRGHAMRNSEIGSLAFFKDGKRVLCTLGSARTVEAFKIGALVANKSAPGDSEPAEFSPNLRKQLKNDPNQEVTHALLSRDEKLLLTAGNSGIVTLWETSTGRQLSQTQQQPGLRPAPPTPSPRARRGTSPWKRSGPGFRADVGNPILAVALSPNNKQFASSDNSAVIALNDVATGGKTGELAGHASSVIALAFAGGGRWLVSLSGDRTLRVWDVENRKESAVFDAGVGAALAVTPDGRRIAVSGNDATLRIWELDNPQGAQVLRGNANIKHLAFSARGTRLAAVAQDNAITVWSEVLGQSSRPETVARVESPQAALVEAKQKPPPQLDKAALAFAGTRAGQMRDDNGLKAALVWIPSGNFTMGSQPGPNHRVNEGPAEVTLTGFWLGKYEVTQSDWKRVMETTPWRGENNAKAGDDFPATYLSWEDAAAFCQKLTRQERAAGRLPASWAYNLPTEAEWEYACRAGTATPYSFGKADSQLAEHGWFKRNASLDGQRYAHAVGGREPNGWGLYDMHGNVAEWCRDWYAPQLQGGTNPQGPPAAVDRVLRGGGWRSDAEDCASASRSGSRPATRTATWGFRIAIVPSTQ